MFVLANVGARHRSVQRRCEAFDSGAAKRLQPAAASATESPMPLPRSAPPFRADHVGSMLRPPALLAARDKHRRGELAADALKRLEDEAIREVVRLQEEIGLKAVTDGEFRRTLWHMD